MDEGAMGMVGMVVDMHIHKDRWEIALVCGARLILRDDTTTEPRNRKPHSSHSHGLEEVSQPKKDAAGSSPAYTMLTLAFPWVLHPPLPLQCSLTTMLVQKTCTLALVGWVLVGF